MGKGILFPFQDKSPHHSTLGTFAIDNNYTLKENEYRHVGHLEFLPAFSNYKF